MNRPRRIQILHVIGARPNFMKAAPLLKRLKKDGRFKQYLVHTGQHYDQKMSEVFFSDLSLPRPDFYLNSRTDGVLAQFADIIFKFSRVVEKVRPSLVIVYGDVNSTLACALVAKKMGIKLAHVEAGLRSFDSLMPEETNRILTDQASDLLFVHSPEAITNLANEGIKRRTIKYVGNLMIDSLVGQLPASRKSGILRKYGLKKGSYSLLTLHRPSNVDKAFHLKSLMSAFVPIGKKMRVVFPVHPRTLAVLRTFWKAPELEAEKQNMTLLDPLRYRDFLKLLESCYCVLTDSGGIQEEAAFLGIPCLTLRNNTERPVTVLKGLNQIVGTRPKDIQKAFASLSVKTFKKREIKFWDGRAASRVYEVLSRELYHGV